MVVVCGVSLVLVEIEGEKLDMDGNVTAEMAATNANVDFMIVLFIFDCDGLSARTGNRISEMLCQMYCCIAMTIENCNCRRR